MTSRKESDSLVGSVSDVATVASTSIPAIAMATAKVMAEKERTKQALIKAAQKKK